PHAKRRNVTHSASDPLDLGDDLTDELCRIARLAGAAIMAFYGNGPAVRVKADASPVTAADEAAEAIILPALDVLMPGVPIVSEDAASQGHVPDIGPEGRCRRFWLVDPLDGTREFLGGNGEFTVNIALVEGTRPALGVVHVPASGVTYVGAGPGRATRQED